MFSSGFVCYPSQFNQNYNTNPIKVSNGLYTTLLAPFRGSKGSAKMINHIKIAMIRTFLNNSTIRQQQALAPTIDGAYPAFAKKQGFTPSNVELSDGTKAYWFGNKDAEKILLWFHGGGYNMPPDPGHLIYVNELTSSTNGKVASLMLSYALAPHEVYPYQLRQAVELVRYVCTELKRKPQNVTIAGDSAGANLANGVLSHLLHPHPEIPALHFAPGEKLGAAILLCPWASFQTDWPSVKYNAKSDFVGAKPANYWSKSFLGGKKSDAYSEPLLAEQEWWNGLDGVVEEILIVGGGGEVLLDVIKELGRRFELAHGKVTMVIAEGEWHDKPVTIVLGMGGESSEVIKSYVNARL